MKPIFTKADPLGSGSELVNNYWRYDEKKNHQFVKEFIKTVKPGELPIPLIDNPNHRWGSDRDIKKAKLFPRGKAYDRLWEVCVKREFETQACI